MIVQKWWLWFPAMKQSQQEWLIYIYNRCSPDLDPHQKWSVTGTPDLQADLWKNCVVSWGSSKTTKHTPFELLMGHNPRAEIFNVVLSMPIVTLRIDLWKQAQKWANELISIKVQSGWKKARDKKEEFKIGDKVWLEGCNQILHITIGLVNPV